MTKIQRRRLFKLARHLEKPARKRFHAKFNFAIVCKLDEDSEGNLCGTAGCALGECPAAFPKHWRFEREPSIIDPGFIFDFIRLRRHSHDDCFADAEVFFGVNYDEAQHLFHPNHQDTVKYGGVYLNDHATAKQVAKNIRAFLKVKSNE